MTELLKELGDDAAAALKYDALAEKHRERIRANLPRARRAGAGLAELERTIHSVYVSKTIGRWTADDLPAEKPKRRRKRPGAAPNAS